MFVEAALAALFPTIHVSQAQCLMDSQQRRCFRTVALFKVDMRHVYEAMNGLGLDPGVSNCQQRFPFNTKGNLLIRGSTRSNSIIHKALAESTMKKILENSLLKKPEKNVLQSEG